MTDPDGKVSLTHWGSSDNTAWVGNTTLAADLRKIRPSMKVMAA